jgi:dTDP-4-amino-4,6-dideoxygalactose transaminase
MTLKGYYSNDHQEKSVYFFSLARHALKEGLKALGLKKGGSVLVPSFICRDVLGPFNELGMKVVFFDLNESLNPILSVDQLPAAHAILAVHYFGLETNLSFYKNYCTKHSAILIEDNAHGLFSRDSNAKLLGHSGEMGIISVRKSLPVTNGALLIINKSCSIDKKDVIEVSSSRLRIKNALRPLVAKLGIRFLLTLTNIKRKIRKILKGSEFPVSGNEDEFVVPMLPNSIDLDKYFLEVDIAKEIKRRRDLFKEILEILSQEKIRPLRTQLHSYEVPYVFPFFCELENTEKVKSRLLSQGLEMINWPALPTKIMENSPADYYHNLYMVKFLW